MFFYLIVNRFIGSIFLISGTAIGAGMIGLPIKILGINFYFNLIIFFILWIIMLLSAIAMLEISLWVDGSLNIVSISKRVFGNIFCFIVVFFYIFFLYSLVSAYISGITTMLNDLFLIKNNIYLCEFLIKILYILPFVFSIILGLNFIDYLNRFFVIMLFFSYFLLSFNIYNFSKLNINSLTFLNYKTILFSLSIMITSFGYSLLIPSLKKYLFNNSKIICLSILIGSFIPFIIYIIWEFIILNFFLSTGNKLYLQTLFGEGNPTEKLIILVSVNNLNIFYMIFIFSFFAISSSFIGVTLSMYDFLFDLLKLNKFKIKNKILILFLILFFPMIFNFIYPYGFMLALSYAGIFASLLLILFPIYTLWYGRYIKKLVYNFILIKNKFFLFIIFSIGILVGLFDLVEKIFY